MALSVTNTDMQPINRINFDSTRYNFTAKLVPRASEPRYIRLIPLIGSSTYSCEFHLKVFIIHLSAIKNNNNCNVLYIIQFAVVIFVLIIFLNKRYRILNTSIYSYNFLQNKFCTLDTYIYFFLINSIFLLFVSLYLINPILKSI